MVRLGILAHATSANALAALDAAIKTHSRPASVAPDHGIRFYASESETHRRGRTEFVRRLENLQIRHVLARVRHPPTNGKIERFHDEIELHLAGFEAESAAVRPAAAPPGPPPVLESLPLGRSLERRDEAWSSGTTRTGPTCR